MDQRGAGRNPAEFAARCLSMGNSTGASLRNISSNGCLLETAEILLGEGNPVRIKIPGISSLDGRVVWAEGARAGVEFSAALHPAVVDYIALKTDAEGCGGPGQDQALAG